MATLSSSAKTAPSRNQALYPNLVPQQQDTASHLQQSPVTPQNQQYDTSYPSQHEQQQQQHQPSQPVNERVQVYVRVRPLFNQELLEDMHTQQSYRNLQSPSPLKNNNNFTETDEEDSQQQHNDPNRTGSIRFKPNQSQQITLDIRPKEPKKDFVFRSVFRPESTQLDVFHKTALPLVMHVLNGYNGTYFVYGQTGTGKTHSMGVLSQIDETSKGVIPQSLEFIFSSLEELQNENLISDWKVHISFFQIYLEQVSDLLNPESKNMSIRQEQNEVFVGDLVEVPVESLEQAMNIVNAGLVHRQMASQSMNETSSRSHTVLHIDVYQTRHKQDSHDQVEYLKGRLVLVDLAGSERVNKTHSKGIRFEEAKHINQSLTTLGNVISCLANPGNRKQTSRGGSKDTHFIPYRSSKLTRILTNSLSYDSKIVLLATLGPVRSSFHESLGTLTFAQRCQDIILKPKMHLETDQETPLQIIERLKQHISDQESSHRHQIGKMQDEMIRQQEEMNRIQDDVNLRENHIQVLEQQLGKVQKLLKDQDQEQATQQETMSKPNYRSMQVADMTTFMAKLLSKLTEMSCQLANQYITDSNEFLTALNNDDHIKKGLFESRVNQEFPIDYIKQFEFLESENLQFDSNTQLLTDDNLDIADLVTQLQNLAKKHNSSLSTMAEQSKLSVRMRVRATQLEKEKFLVTGHLHKSIRENTEMLLNEIMKMHKSPYDLPRYFQTLLPQLHDLDIDFQNRVFQRARDLSKQEYQLREQSYSDKNPSMLTSFPQQKMQLIGAAQVLQQPIRPLVGQQQLQASIATSHDPKPNKLASQHESSNAVAKSHNGSGPPEAPASTMSPILENRRQAFKKSPSGTTGVVTESMTSSQNTRKPLDLVLHRHPLHKDNAKKTQDNSLPNQSIQSHQEHSFASIVKTAAQQASNKQIERQSPSHGDKEPKKPLINKNAAPQQHHQFEEKDGTHDESLQAYANELANDAREEKQRYSSVDEQRNETRGFNTTTKKQRDLSANVGAKDYGDSMGDFNLLNQSKARNQAYESNQSKRTNGSKRSQATLKSSAHQQIRLDNLLLISKGMNEKIFEDLHDFFLQEPAKKGNKPNIHVDPSMLRR